jgi:hypothetical protein
MTITISNVYVKTYENIVRHLAQQRQNRLRVWCMERSVQSEAHNWETMNSVEASIKATTGRIATPEVDSVWGRRQTQPVTYHVGDTVEDENIVQMVVDPLSNIAQSHGTAMHRSHDTEIIAAATGQSRQGDGTLIDFPDGTVNGDVEQNPSNAMDQTVGDYSTPLSFDFVTETTEKFMYNDIDPDMDKVMVIGPRQARKLLQLTEATSGDYNTMKPLASKGYVESWMGYSWLVHTGLNYPTAPGTDVDCFAMTRKALGLQMNRDITAEIAKDPSYSFMWRIYCKSTFGAIRVEDKHLVWLKLADTI